VGLAARRLREGGGGVGGGGVSGRSGSALFICVWGQWAVNGMLADGECDTHVFDGVWKTYENISIQFIIF
jgi:hypothetical protein